MKRGRNEEGSNDVLSRSILMDFIKEGETIGTAAAVIQVEHFSLPRTYSNHDNRFTCYICKIIHILHFKRLQVLA